MIRQGLAPRFCRGDFTRLRAECRRLVARFLLGTYAFQFFQGKFELRDRIIHLLGTPAELHATEFGNNELEVFNFCLLSTHHRLEQSGVVRQ